MPARHQILVEGVNDQHVIGHLLKQYGINCELIDREPMASNFSLVVIRKTNGYENLLISLRTRLKEDSLERLAIIVDADIDLVSRWESLRNRLAELGAVDLPVEPLINGTTAAVVLPDRVVQVGIWLMPDNTTPGGLETFAGFLMPADDVLWPHANIATWLAWQRAPGMRLGEALSASLLDKNAGYAQELVAWVRKLFDLS